MSLAWSLGFLQVAKVYTFPGWIAVSEVCRFTITTSIASAGGIWFSGWLVPVDSGTRAEVYGVGRSMVVGGVGRWFIHFDRMSRLMMT